MIKKKICMLGSFAVGKTSLIQRFVNSIFSEKYHTTIGVKIDQKRVRIDDKEVNLLLWDIHGEDEFQKVKQSYLIGASGYLLVMDGTRKKTYDVARLLHEKAVAALGDVPFIFIINKNDLKDDWDVDDELINIIKDNGWDLLLTSAKTGEGVELAFKRLVKKMIGV
jgi:small GTP-binding protein